MAGRPRPDIRHGVVVFFLFGLAKNNSETISIWYLFHTVVVFFLFGDAVVLDAAETDGWLKWL